MNVKLMKYEVKRKKSKRKIVLSILFAFIILFILLLLIAPPLIVHFVSKGPATYRGIETEKYPLQGLYSASDFDLTSTELDLATSDNLHLWASEVYVYNPKAVIIYLSGIRQPSVTYFYGHSKWMKENGYASILLEVRAHGLSEGTTIGLGYEETKDVAAVLDYIASQEKYKDVPIVIHGVSMGGVVAINAFGEFEEIDGIIAMSACSSFDDIIYENMLEYHVPKWICDIEKPLISQSLKLKFGEKVDHFSPINQIKNSNGRPVFFISATGDREVHPSNTERLIKEAPSATSWLRNSNDHFIVKDNQLQNVKDDTEYCKQVLDFLEQNIAKY